MDTLVISPHFDDAVFSCGEFISQWPGTTVLTVCGGKLPRQDVLTAYDEKCGFTSSYEAMVQRAHENTRALETLGAQGMDMQFLDEQYRHVPLDVSRLRSGLWEVMRNAHRLIIPLGLLHSDHIVVADICLELCREGIQEFFVYEDLPYRVVDPLPVPERLNRLEHMRLKRPHTDIWENTMEIKERAIRCYTSQLGVGDINIHNLLVPERYWRVVN